MSGMRDHPATSRPLRHGTPAAEPLSAQQRFERAWRESVGPTERGLGATVRSFGRQLTSPAAAPERYAPAGDAWPHLNGLERIGCVSLHGLRVPADRRRVDHLIVAGSGIYVVEDRPWTGQVEASGDQLYVDGRLRSGVPEAVSQTAASVQSALADELANLSVPVQPVLCLPAAEPGRGSLAVAGVAVFTGRGLVRFLRHAEPTLGSDTIVRLALVAVRLLEPAAPTSGGSDSSRAKLRRR